MNFPLAPLALIATCLAVAESGGGGDGITSQLANLRRRLSYSVIAGYSPGTQVTDHCAIDLDQAAIEDQLDLRTPESFRFAQKIYNDGGNSKSYAQVTLTTPLTAKLRKGDEIIGENAEGSSVGGKAYKDFDSGESVIKVQYITTDIQENYVQCQVGALLVTNMKGCFAQDGDLMIGGNEYPYTYIPTRDNKNGRTIAGFSEGDSAKNKMRVGCTGCPYTDFQYFYDYYGTDDYAHQYIEAAFEDRATQFKNGNADFSLYDFTGRQEIIKKATVYLNIFMYVIREFEDALDDCTRGCINCNSDPVSAWDEGVCFYTGSKEGPDAKGTSYLLHELADKRCADFKTCGVEGTNLDGMSKLNYDIFNLFAVGQFQLQTGNCPAARFTTQRIISKLYVPMIQGALRYAYKVGELQGGEKEKAEGAVFSAAVLPRIHAASPSAATTIYNNMKVGATKTDVLAVKRAFESTYQSMGISCDEIGGFWSDGERGYFDGMGPCEDIVNTMTPVVVTESDSSLAIGLGCSFGALFAIAAAMLVYMRSREKEGNPVFRTSEAEIKEMN